MTTTESATVTERSSSSRCQSAREAFVRAIIHWRDERASCEARLRVAEHELAHALGCLMNCECQQDDVNYAQF